MSADPDRLNGFFELRQVGQAADGDNEACITVLDGAFWVIGEVHGVNLNCLVAINYLTDAPHKASGTVLRGPGSQGSVKISQSVGSEITITIGDNGPFECGEPGTAFGEPEKCKVSASLKGTEAALDVADASRIKLACDLGPGLSALDVIQSDQPLTAGQVQVIVGAFADRDDVRIDDRGRLSITQEGEADTVTPYPLCAE